MRSYASLKWDPDPTEGAGIMDSDSAGGREPLVDTRDEAGRLVESIKAHELTAVLIGGIAIYRRCPSAAQPTLRREYQDIDLVTERSMVTKLTSLLESLGHVPDKRFNALHGGQRLFFWDERRGRQLDVFGDRFEMCHSFDLRGRIGMDAQAFTLPLADLLLTKLQIVESNQKDLQDAAALLQDHAFTRDETGINIECLTRTDWGLQRTIELTMEKLRAAAEPLSVPAAPFALPGQLSDLKAALDAAPKSTAWKLRAKLGERKRWYELPEESRG